jgi:thioredoxin 2
MIRSCPTCGAKNRVPASHLSDTGRCGKCKGALPPVDVPIDIQDASEFRELVAQSAVPVLVDFWAAWCAPCQAAAPHVKKVAHDLRGKAIVAKVDTDKNQQVAGELGVRGIPNFVVFKGGKAVKQQAGLVDAATLTGWLRDAGA